ncbi:MAG: MraY family glycosyltransferase [Pseudomonadota bacterium]
MNYLFLIAAATMISLAVIPIMVRLAPKLGMMDMPDDNRKVHSNPIARVGGWGIIIGALIPVITLTEIDSVVLCYLFGSIVLLIFGALDDKREMGHYMKFIGQFIAVIPMVYLGGLYVTDFPFFGDSLFPIWLAQLFSLVAMIGVINAINHSDGLDGLAGGEALFSLGALALLAWLSPGNELTITLALAAIGGLVGFLRYNTHPAMVFMGDGGSQFLGFTVGFLAILLTQHTDNTLSKSVVLLLLGLPVVDILIVLKKRAMSGSNIFKATRNHMHHRLLSVGFEHKESVVIIYSIHTFLVSCGVWLASANDYLITALYLIVCATTYFLLNMAERTGWRPGQTRIFAFLSDSLAVIERNQVLMHGSRRFLELAIPAYLVALSIWINDIPREFAIVAAILAVLLALQSINIYPFRVNARRGIIYITVVFVIYLSTIDRITWQNPWAVALEIMFYSAVCMAIFLAIRFSPGRRKEEFKITSFDYLLLFLIVGALLFAKSPLLFGNFNINVFIVVLAIVLYASELLLVERRERMDYLSWAAFFTLMVIAVRGFNLIEFNIALQP